MIHLASLVSQEAIPFLASFDRYEGSKMARVGWQTRWLLLLCLFASLVLRSSRFFEGLRSIISSQPDMLLVAQATNAVEAVAEFRRHRPDVTLMDLRLPGANGTDALIAIRGEVPQARVIILSTADTDREIQRAMRAGASAYLFKSMISYSSMPFVTCPKWRLRYARRAKEFIQH